MTGPEQVSVNVADLETLRDITNATSAAWALTESGVALIQAVRSVVAAIPKPEWEPTDDMLLRFGYAHAHVESERESITYLVDFLKAMHREGLL